MRVEGQLTIHGSRAAVWSAVSDIENAAKIVSGIQNVDIVERPAKGLVGLRWRETRILFGEPATVEKWVTDAADNEFYTARATEKGFVFLTTTRVSEGPDGIIVTSSHDSLPQTFAAKMQSIPMALFFRGVIRKAIMQDLNDIKAAVERA
jgi:hypothetical protein